MSPIVRRSTLASTIILAVLAATACGGSDSGPSAPPGPSPRPVAGPDSTVLTRPAKPLGIAVTFDRARAAKAFVTTDGGTITATSVDGTRYTLTIPKDGLFESDTITVIPVSATNGRRVGADGPAAAVQFEPEGLRFVTPATLRIEPSTPIPAENQIALGWHGSGENAHLEPLDPTSRDIVMPITHFSGAAIGMVNVGDNIWVPKVNWAEYTPQEFEDRARQYLSELMREQRRRAERGEPMDPELADKVREVREKEWELVFKPILDRAAGDCQYANGNISKVLGFERENQLMGMGDVAPGLMDGVVAAADNCWKDQKSRCRMPDDVARLRDILRNMRMEALIGRQANLDEVPVCGDAWSGTFEANVLASPDGARLKISGTVLFKRDRQAGLTEYYKPVSGTLSWSLSGPYAGNCTVAASGTATIQAGDGTLAITRTLNGATTYTGSGSSALVTNLKVSCPDRDYNIPENGTLPWFNPPRTPLSVPGTETTRISGSNSDVTGSWSWNLQAQ
jgi:hypothetical protein